MRIGAALCLGLCSAALCACTPEHAPPDRPSGSPILLDQGARWTDAKRADFYTRDQGSQIMPLAWLTALKQPSGQPFLADSLDRYGYLPNPANDERPAGRLHRGRAGGQRDRRHDLRRLPHAADRGRRSRPIGSTAARRSSDFQSFLADLDTAVGAVLASERGLRRLRRRGAGRHRRPADDRARCARRSSLVPALPHADDPRAADGALGAGPARRGGDDLQPADRPRSRPAAQLPDPGQHPAGRRAGALPVPVERGDPGQDAVAGLRRQRQRHPGPRPQSRRGLRRVRDLPSAEGQLARPGRRLPRPTTRPISTGWTGWRS